MNENKNNKTNEYKHTIKAKSKHTRITAIKEIEGVIGELQGSIAAGPKLMRSTQERGLGNKPVLPVVKKRSQTALGGRGTLSMHPRQSHRLGLKPAQI